MSQLSLLAESLIGSEIVKLGNEIASRIANGEKIYNYTIGDFDPHIFPIPPKLQAEIISAYQHHYTNYPPGDGLKELRQSVADFIFKHQQVRYELDEILIASGGRPLIYTIFRTLVDEDDKVIYAAPSWNNNHYVHMNWGQHCVIDTKPENDFMPSADDIKPHLSQAALLCLCSPQNPTGTTIQRNELEKICDLILEENNRRGSHQKKLYLMFDQMYWTLTFGNTTYDNVVALRPAMKDYTIFVDGISKSFAATGVRVGWGLGPAHVIAKMKAFLSHIGAWSPMAEQKATAIFLRDDAAIAAYFLEFKRKIHERLVYIYQRIMELRSKGFPVDAIAPQAAIYLTIKVDLKGKTHGVNKLNTQKDVTTFLLTEAKLAIVPFTCFGANEEAPWYRVSVGTCKLEDLENMFEGLENALKKLN
ncbi:MAG: pyridoxal phosphate-dependent aminotransferase [Bacteroidetes bacterium]|nr:pyridoxal phosphate-dependent aminotransferase [Bacteroidota bacterium]MBS1740018.1 pyridoxal phosphate-dependent aminotransferase [Bacteroidota bacterium]MBS1777664.1 pyridoxal phosphate-dependent aminotransferase [Bacteroidota bacterium]